MPTGTERFGPRCPDRRSLEREQSHDKRVSGLEAAQHAWCRSPFRIAPMHVESTSLCVRSPARMHLPPASCERAKIAHRKRGESVKKSAGHHLCLYSTAQPERCASCVSAPRQRLREATHAHRFEVSACACAALLTRLRTTVAGRPTNARPSCNDTSLPPALRTRGYANQSTAYRCVTAPSSVSNSSASNADSILAPSSATSRQRGEASAAVRPPIACSSARTLSSSTSARNAS
jgi:hypothetical protein